jgi:hypothetical protein
MSCLKNKEIMEYIDKELSSTRMEEAAAHLETCTRCRKIMNNLLLDIRLVRRNIENLDPAATDLEALRPGTRGTRTAAIDGSPRWRRWLAASVRIPAPVMAVAMVIFVIMSAALFLQHQKILKLNVPFLADKGGQNTTLYVVDDFNVRKEMLDLNLDSFKPISKPKIYKKKYKNAYKVKQANDVL